MSRNAEIAEFILDNYPPACVWEPKTADDWASWAADNGFLFLCYDMPGDQGKLVGLTIARPLSIRRNIEQVNDTDFDQDGEVVYVDLTISIAGKRTLKAMMAAIMQKWGNKQLLVMKRLKTQTKFHCYRLGEFSNKLLGTT